MAVRTARGRRRSGGVRLLAALVAVVLATTGCSLFGDSGDSEGEQVLKTSTQNVPVLDPQVVTEGMWLSLRGIFEGLVSQAANGVDVVPAVAEKWDVSEDGLTYTFHLRDNAKWSNGDPVVAKDFERTYKRLFTPAGTSAGGTTLGANSYQASTGIKGATDFLNGTVTDWSQVGVKATGDHELVLTLAAANPGFLVALTHPALLPLHMDTVEAKPKDWQEAGNLVSNGPYQLKEWVKNSKMVLVPNKNYWDKGKVHLDRIDMALTEPTATATAAVPYENGEVDLISVTDADLVRFQKDPELAKHLRAVEARSLAYLAKLRSLNPLLDDIRVRKALSLGLGRENLAKILPGAKPGVSLVPDTVPGWDDSLAIKEDIAEAKRLLTEAGYPDGKGLPEIKILASGPFPMVDAIIDAWKTNLGIQAKADIVESGVYVERRWAVQPANYVGFYYGTFGGTPNWPTMVQTLWSPKNNQELSLPAAAWTQYQAVQNNKALTPVQKTAQLDAILAQYASPATKQLADVAKQASDAKDKAEQERLYKEATKIRDEQALYIPVTWGSVFFAVRPTLDGVQMRPSPEFYYWKGIKVKK